MKVSFTFSCSCLPFQLTNAYFISASYECVQRSRLSKQNHQRLEIGAGTLEMNLDKDLEDRISFWSNIWSKIPPVQRHPKSPTWKNPGLYRKSRAYTEGTDKKVEL